MLIFFHSSPWVEVNSLSTLTTMAGAEVTEVTADVVTTALVKCKLRSIYGHG